MTSARQAASFKAFLSDTPEDTDGNRNTKAFTDALNDGNERSRTKAFTENRGTVFLAAGNEK